MKTLLHVEAKVMVVLFKSIKPAVKVSAVFIVTGVPITHPIVAAVLFITKVPKLWKPVKKFKVPMLPVPSNVKLEVVLPLKVPAPEMVLAMVVLAERT